MAKNRSLAVCHPFKINRRLFEQLGLSIQKNRQLFESLMLSVQKKYSPVATAEGIYSKKIQALEGLMLSIWKKHSSVRTAEGICLKKKCSFLNGWCYPFRKNIHPFKRLTLQVWKKCGGPLHSWCYPFGKNIQPFEWLLLSIRKKLIRCSNGQWYLMGFSFPNGWDYPFRMSFVQPSEWLCSFKTNIEPSWLKWLRLSILKEKLYHNLKSCVMLSRNSCSNGSRRYNNYDGINNKNNLSG